MGTATINKRAVFNPDECRIHVKDGHAFVSFWGKVNGYPSYHSCLSDKDGMQIPLKADKIESLKETYKEKGYFVTMT